MRGRRTRVPGPEAGRERAADQVGSDSRWCPSRHKPDDEVTVTRAGGATHGARLTTADAIVESSLANGR